VKVQEISLRTIVNPAPDVFEMPASGDLPKRFTVVNRPSFYVFLPPKEKATGIGVVIAPGGGHSQLVIDKEGWEMADWFNQHGIAAFVVKYRLARAVNSTYTVQGDALDDAKQAMRIVRNRAQEWGVDPARIGFMGFSAGGELAALMETRFDTGDAKSEDPLQRVSDRPDFTMLIYPGWGSDTVITVPKDAPPAFLVCADNDPSHVVLTANLYLDLEKQGVSSEMHIYAGGKHGFGLRAPATMPVSTWPDRMKEWMVDRKLLQ
jgi:endo-1,4-beta-xylanase